MMFLDDPETVMVSKKIHWGRFIEFFALILCYILVNLFRKVDDFLLNLFQKGGVQSDQNLCCPH